MPTPEQPATRYIADVPLDVERSMLQSAESLLGRGYVPDYYASAASEFAWLYMAGYRAALADQRAAQRKKRKTA